MTTTNKHEDLLAGLKKHKADNVIRVFASTDGRFFGDGYKILHAVQHDKTLCGLRMKSINWHCIGRNLIDVDCQRCLKKLKETEAQQ